MTKPKVKIKFVDFNGSIDYYQNYFIGLISSFAEVEISENPDYILYSVYGDEHLKYDSIKIYISSEELETDFNMCDYAIGYTDISFYDRYLYLPMFAYPASKIKTERSFDKHKHPNDFYTNRKKFCNFIYSNALGNNFREKTFYALNEYKNVDSAGGFLNNMGNIDIAGNRNNEDYEESKIEFLKDYRFTIAMSNAQKFGYLDEKIFGAWIAGSIPIYWGDPKISEYFNPKAFIDCTGCKTAQEVLEKVKEIDQDEEKYLAMQKEPITLDQAKIEMYFDENRIKEFLKNIFSQNLEDAKRVSDGMHASEYLKKMKLLNKIKNLFFFRVLKKVKYTLRRRGLIK